MNEPTKTRKVKIISDGMPGGTSIVDAETGEPIEGVVGMHVDLTPRGVRATITLTNVAFEAMLTADVQPVLPMTSAEQQP